MLEGREHKGKCIGTDKYNEVSEMTVSYTLPFKSLRLVRFLMIFNNISYAHQRLIKKYSTNRNIVQLKFNIL